MKRLFLMAVVAIMAVACGDSRKGFDVTISNPIALERANETVEIAWNVVKGNIEEATVDNIVVTAGGKQIPSQVIYNGETEPQALIFQATVAGNGSSKYVVTTGTREAYTVQAFGRHVPERKDDYAWENNLIAYRAYGPALEGELITPGIDVWCKSTQDMIINKWYQEGNNYHENKGEGMDCYKVGRTLGGGACVPYVDGKLCLGDKNYALWKTLDNGPIRTSVTLTYAPFKAGDKVVAMTRTISLDANSHFNKMTSTFSGDFQTLPIAAGVVMHDVKAKSEGAGYAALTEAVSDSPDPERDGDISLGVVMPTGKVVAEVEEHLVITGTATPNEAVVFWIGSGWSQGGIASAEAWAEQVQQMSEKAKNPLKVTL